MSPAAASHLAMLAFSLLVAGSFALGSLAANDISPLALNTVRFWLAAAVMAVIMRLRGGMPAAARAAPWRYFVLAALFVTYFVLMFEGLKTARPVSATAVFTLTPLMTAGFGWLLLRQVLTPWMALALLIGALGAVWVIFEADIDALLALDIGKGEAIYFAGCVAHALYTPMVAKLNRGEGAFVVAYAVILAGALILTVLSWQDLWATDWGKLPGIVWITIAYTALAASVATITLLQFASLRLPASKVMAYTYLTPSWAIVWQVALSNPVPRVWILAGVALTVVALLMLLREEPAAR